jgi:hypothetical protein
VSSNTLSDQYISFTHSKSIRHCLKRIRIFTISILWTVQGDANIVNVERQIPNIIHLLTEGSPVDQRDALESYFLPDSFFIHPLCRIPSFSHVSVPGVGEINSRWVTWMIYRWYKILSPRIILKVECDGTLPFPVAVEGNTYACLYRVQPKIKHPLRRD